MIMIMIMIMIIISIIIMNMIMTNTCPILCEARLCCFLDLGLYKPGRLDSVIWMVGLVVMRMRKIMRWL